MHLALNSNVGVGDGGGKELADGAKEEGNGGGDLSALLDGVLHLLKKCVLEDWVDDEHQGGDDAREESLGALVLEESHEGADGGRGGGSLLSLAGLEIAFVVLLARGDARVDDPDGVGEDDGSRTSNGTGNHGLDGRELLVGAASRSGSLLEERARPLVPVVVDEVRDADAEKRRVDARVQTGHALARNNLLNGIDELALCLFGLDLGAGREGDERVAVGEKKQVRDIVLGRGTEKEAYHTSKPWTGCHRQRQPGRERHCRSGG